MHRARRLMEERSQRIQKVYDAIENNEGIEIGQLKALMSLQLKVSEGKIDEYIRILDNANLIVVDMYKAWTNEGHKRQLEELERIKGYKEDEMMREAKKKKTIPLDAFDLEP